MKPIKFKGCNFTLTAPKDQPEIKELPCCRAKDGNVKVVVSCWQINNLWEWFKILFTGKIWLVIQGQTHSPLYIEGKLSLKYMQEK